MTRTAEQAERMFRAEMEAFVIAARTRITVPLVQRQFDALVSFFFNEGAGAGASLVAAINSGHLDRVPHAFLLYIYAKNERTGRRSVWPGLVDRRNKEVALWLGTYRDHRLPADPDGIMSRMEAEPRTAAEPETLNDATVSGVSGVSADSVPVTAAGSVVSAFKSRTVWALAASAWASLGNGFESAVDAVSGLFGRVGDIKADADAAYAPIQSILDMAKVNAPTIGTGIAVACLIVAIVRHVDLKQGTPAS
jgi:hypothetical protein